MINKENIVRRFEISLDPNEKKTIVLKSPKTVDKNGEGTDDYSPYRNITYLNNGSYKIEAITNNQESGFEIPGKTIKQLPNANVHTFTVKNLEGTATTLSVVVDNYQTVEGYLDLISKLLIGIAQKIGVKI